MPDLIRPTDDNARSMAQDLLAQARTAALAVISQDGAPMVTRVAFGLSQNRLPMTLISELSAHTNALRMNPACSLLIGDPGTRGDPLNQPRLTLQALATLIPNGTALYQEMATHYLRSHPKSKLYIGFADFSFALFKVKLGHLNGGFGKAFTLTPEDMGIRTG